MAIIEFVKGKNSKLSGLKNVLNYIKNPEKTHFSLINAFNCDPRNTYESFYANKYAFDKLSGGRQFVHFTQSFSKDDEIEPELCNKIGKRLIEECEVFKKFQVIQATHLDKSHLHNHFVINTVNVEDGKKWHLSKYDLKAIKSYNDKLCIEYGLSVPEKNYEHISHGQYQAFQNESSWKHELALTIRECAYASQNLNDFNVKMNQLGYGVDWEYNREKEKLNNISTLIKKAAEVSLTNIDFENFLKMKSIDVDWHFKLSTSSLNTGEITNYEFDNYEEFEQLFKNIDRTKFDVKYTSDISYVYGDDVLKPETFDNNFHATGRSILNRIEQNNKNYDEKLSNLVESFLNNVYKTAPESLKSFLEEVDNKSVREQLYFKDNELNLRMDSEKTKSLHQNILSSEHFDDNSFKKIRDRFDELWSFDEFLNANLKFDDSRNTKEKLRLAVKASKQHSTNRDEFNNFMKSLGYDVEWERPGTKKQIIEAITKEAIFKSKTIEDFENTIKTYGFYFAKTENGYVVSDSENIEEYKLTKYDYSVILGDFKKGKLSDEQLEKIIERRYKNENEIEKQLQIFRSRLDNLKINGLITYNNNIYEMTDKCKEQSKGTHQFEFTSYDSNVIFEYINNKNGKMTQSDLLEMVKEKYNSEEDVKKQFDYLVRRLHKNIKIGTIELVGKNYKITETGFQKKNELNESKKNNEKKPLMISLSTKHINNLLGKERDTEKKSLDEIKEILKKDMKYVTFIDREGVKRRNTQFSWMRQYSKEGLIETFELNKAMKKIVDNSKYKNPKAFIKTSKNMGYELSYDDIKQQFNFVINENLKCYFTYKNAMALIGDVQLPNTNDIYYELYNTIMFKTPNGMLCSNRNLMPSDLYSKDEILNKIETNYPEHQENFSFLVSFLRNFIASDSTNGNKLPLSKLEGQALKEKLLENQKGKGIEF
jgi:hypothetical protein